VPSQKCWVSGVGFGRARAGSAIPVIPPWAGPRPPAGSDLDATLDGPASTVQLACRMPRIPAGALLLGPERWCTSDPAR